MNLASGELSFARGPDFFALPRAQGSHSKTLLLRNADGRLVGLASYTTLRTLQRGARVSSLYCSDVRFAPHMERATKSQFRSFYSDLTLHLSKLEDLGHPAHLLTILSDDNTAAKKAFLKREGAVIYRPVWEFQGKVVLGRLPGFKSKGMRARFCLSLEVAELKRYLEEQVVGKELSYSLEEISARLEALSLTWEDFLIVKDPEERIIGAGLVTSDNAFRRPVVKVDDWRVKLVGGLAALLGQPRIPDGGELRTSYLAYHSASTTSARLALIDSAWQAIATRDHALILSESAQAPASTLLRQGFLSQPIAGTLYQVVHRDHYAPPFLLRRKGNEAFRIDTHFL